MANQHPPVTDFQLLEALEAWESTGHMCAEAARRVGLSRTTFRDRLAKAQSQLRGIKGAVAPAAVPPGLEAGKRTVQYDAAGNVVAEWRRLHPTAEALRAIVDELLALVEGKARPIADRAQKGTNALVAAEGKMLEVPLFDQHFGKYCWADETGQDFDSAKAEKLVVGAVERAAAAAGPVEQALLVIGGDYFHADSRHNTTERGGHVLDVDTRQAKVWEAATRALHRAVEVLAAKADSVQLVVIPGNHDWESAFHLQRLLAAYYRKEARVHVLESPRSRAYVIWGKVLLGFAHGHLIPMQDLAGLMASEVPGYWADSTERVWHLGHIHKRKGLRYLSGDTFQGVQVEHLESLAGTDAWHHEQGYVGNPRRLEAFVWHQDRGLIARHYVNAEAIP